MAGSSREAVIGYEFLRGWQNETVVNEAVSGFAHLYAYGVSKCTTLAGLTGRPIHNLDDVNCPPPDSFNHER